MVGGKPLGDCDLEAVSIVQRVLWRGEVQYQWEVGEDGLDEGPSLVGWREEGRQSREEWHVEGCRTDSVSLLSESGRSPEMASRVELSFVWQKQVKIQIKHNYLAFGLGMAVHVGGSSEGKLEVSSNTHTIADVLDPSVAPENGPSFFGAGQAAKAPPSKLQQPQRCTN